MLEVIIDASEIIKWFNLGRESMFMEMTDFEAIEKELGIEFKEGEE